MAESSRVTRQPWRQHAPASHVTKLLKHLEYPGEFRVQAAVHPGSHRAREAKQAAPPTRCSRRRKEPRTSYYEVAEVAEACAEIAEIAEIAGV